jgi:hypothetical protein
MAERSRHRVSEGHEGRSERPAMRHGQPRPTQDVTVPVFTVHGKARRLSSPEASVIL